MCGIGLLLAQAGRGCHISFLALPLNVLLCCLRGNMACGRDEVRGVHRLGNLWSSGNSLRSVRDLHQYHLHFQPKSDDGLAEVRLYSRFTFVTAFSQYPMISLEYPISLSAIFRVYKFPGYPTG